jgi:hypothetical protein
LRGWFAGRFKPSGDSSTRQDEPLSKRIEGIVPARNPE